MTWVLSKNVAEEPRVGLKAPEDAVSTLPSLIPMATLGSACRAPVQCWDPWVCREPEEETVLWSGVPVRSEGNPPTYPDLSALPLPLMVKVRPANSSPRTSGHAFSCR